MSIPSGPPPAARLVTDELKRRGWSQNDLAEKLGVNSGTLSRWMDGTRRMTRVDVALRIQELLGVDAGLWSRPGDPKVADESGDDLPAVDPTGTSS